MKTYHLDEGSPQWDFFHCRTPVQFMGGGFANGKTTAGCIKGLTLATNYPGSTGLVARATYPKLNGTTRKEFIAWTPPNQIAKRPTQDDNTLYLKNGSSVQFRYVAQKGKNQEDGSTSSNLLSAQYDWILVDQIEDPEFEYKDFLDLIGRLRGQTDYRPPPGEPEDPTMPPNGPRWLILTANPSRNWVYRELIQPLKMYQERGVKTEKLLVDKETGEILITLVEGSTYTNARNIPKDYIRNLEAAYTGQMRDRYILGVWAAYEGLVHPDFNPSRHLLPRETILNHLRECIKRHVRVRVIEGYDFGIAAPSCYMLGFVDDKGRVFFIDGFYRREFKYTDQPQAINDIRARYDHMLSYKDAILADPDIFRRKVVAGVETGETVARLFASLGVRMRPANNEVKAGIAKINGYLAGLPDLPPVCESHGEYDVQPLLYFAEELDFVQSEMTSYYWKRNPQGEYIDEPQERNDHAMDVIKYSLSRLPEASKIVIPSAALPPKWMFWHEETIHARAS